MSKPPPKKKLKQATIFEGFRKQRSGSQEGRKGEQADSEVIILDSEDSEDQVAANMSDKTGEERQRQKECEIRANAAESRRCGNSPVETSDTTPKYPTVEKKNLSIKVTDPTKSDAGKLTSPTCAGDETLETTELETKEKTNKEEDSEGSNVSATLEYDGSQSLFSDSDADVEMLEDTPLQTTQSVLRTDKPSKGTAKTELNTEPSCSATLPPLKPSPHHTILFRPHIQANKSPRPYPDSYKDRWDALHVRMPCSPENLYPAEGKDGKKELRSRWNMIEDALLGEMTNSLDIEEAILTYNQRYSQKWDFRGLHAFFMEVLNEEESQAFFKETLPKMVQLALQLPEVCTGSIPLLKCQQSHSVTLTQHQAACLLANAFFCTYPRRNARGKQSEYSTFPDINFNQLFQGSKGGINQRKAEKLKCLLHYFRRVTTHMPTGTITFTRQHIPASEFPKWEQSSAKLTRLHISAQGNIEDDGVGMLQVDFANKFLGGGVLGFGCVQEEIRFLICPEMILSRLMTEQLEQNECLLMTGCERYSNYVGYADSFQWNGDHQDPTPRDIWGRRCTTVVAIDALVFHSYSEQFSARLLRRELNKAYCGFYRPDTERHHLSALATGNWGCGAFGGDHRLKALIQLMAAAEAERDVCYFTFDDWELRDDIHEIHKFLIDKDLAVSDIWAHILQYRANVCDGRTRKPSQDILQFIYRAHSNCDNDSDDDNDESQEVQSKWEKDSPTGHPKSKEPDWQAHTP